MEPQRFPDRGLSHKCHASAANRAAGRENPTDLRPPPVPPQAANRAEEPRRLPHYCTSRRAKFVSPRFPGFFLL